MLSTIWAGATNASDALLLAAAVVAALEALLYLVRGTAEAALLPVAVALVALGFARPLISGDDGRAPPKGITA